MPPQTPTTSIRTTGVANAFVLKTEYYIRRFLEPFRKMLITVQLANREQLPRGEGKNATWVLPDAEPTGTTGAGDPDYILTEGTDPTDSLAFTFTKIAAPIQQRGAFFELSDLADQVAIDGTTQSYVDATSYHARLILDNAVFTELSAFAGATQNAGASITAEELRKAAVAHRQNSVPTHPATPGGRFYCFVTSVEGGYDLVGEGAPAWFQAKETASLQGALTTPLDGTPANTAIYDVIVKTTDNSKRDTTPSPDDDLSYLLGRDAFGISELTPPGTNAEVLIKPSSQGGMSSPLNMRGIIGWKMQYRVKGLQANAIRKVLSDATGIG